MMKNNICFALLAFLSLEVYSQPKELEACNIVWNSQSHNSSESMPCGGGDVGLNVWAENGEILFYLSRSGTFDENNGFLKLGRVRLKLSPNPFSKGTFRQELVLKDGFVKIDASYGKLSASVNIWVDVFRPVVHIEISGNQTIKAEAIYESWRYTDRLLRKGESFGNSFKWESTAGLKTLKDEVTFDKNSILFYHRNSHPDGRDDIFDLTVRNQGLDSVKSKLFNPLKNLTFGGSISGANFIPAGNVSGKYLNTDFQGWKLQSRSASKKQSLEIYLHTEQAETINDWKLALQKVKNVDDDVVNKKTAKLQTQNWWHQFWNRSFVYIDSGIADPSSPQWQVGRNYQLFRYMLGCNAFGSYPTRFNGGLFTVDPCFTDSTRRFTPDFRNWGGGTFTAQNQRLVYFPMIKSGDFDLMKPQFDFYLRLLRNAELRTKVYWGHSGACFTEQLENFGLPNYTEYGVNRPLYFEKGVEYNAWLEYEWDTALEFCLMILEKQRYTSQDISEYLPLIQSCLTFFDQHYQYLAKQRGRKALDGNGKLVLYPGSAGETYKMSYNSTSTIAALQTVAQRLLDLPANYLNDSIRSVFGVFLKRIPPLNYLQVNGKITISPALHWERVNNTESMQLYPVFPWRIFAIGKPGLDTAINTWQFDIDAVKFRSSQGWKQDNIWAACLGLTDEAADLNIKKLQDSNRRFPAFWGPGFDWVPDHNHGGSGMIGIQEMLLQCDGEKILVFPTWPNKWDVHFRLSAPYNTIVEGEVKNGKVEMLKVVPENRMKDVINMFQNN